MEYTPRINDNALAARAAAAGSMVLLKNVRSTLPLTAERAEPLPIAVFGVGQIYTVCCTEAMQPWRRVCVLDALAASERVKPDGLLAHKYRSWCLEHPAGDELPLSSLSMDELAEHSAAAVAVITRTPEDYRPQLTRQEQDMLRTICAAFPRTVLVLNTPGYMELGEFAQLLPAIVFMGIAGQEGGHALTDLLTGRVMPSGRLAHSWPETLAELDEAAQALDCFNGYRWFDSFDRPVLYPFGYGLGYGKSELVSVSMGLDGCDVVVTAEVLNSGEKYPVQEVVQVYYSNPDSERTGAISCLDCFQKTRPLDPGERQLLTLRFPVTEMAVFRESASAFVLEEGYYDIRVGTSSRSTYIAGSIRLTRSAVVQAIAPMQMPACKDRVRSGAGFTYPEEQEELSAAKAEKERLFEELRILLLPRDPNDDKSVIVEIRGGVGGEESALFAHSLYRMYTMYAQSKGWKVTLLNYNETELGGVKEADFEIDGDGAYSRLKFESGVHRVQRVPETESGGRVHTSTATVAVLPEMEEAEVDIRPEDIEMQVFRSSGAGGQHINKTSSAVRLIHKPSGIVVSCQEERSQVQNREKCMQMLASKLYEIEQSRIENEVSTERRSQVGTGMRNERIRTYNFPQGRVTDHRIGLTLYKIDAIMDGDLDELIDALVTADQAKKLQTQQE